jgi:hypothetical protein
MKAAIEIPIFNLMLPVSPDEASLCKVPFNMAFIRFLNYIISQNNH